MGLMRGSLLKAFFSPFFLKSSELFSLLSHLCRVRTCSTGLLACNSSRSEQLALWRGAGVVVEVAGGQRIRARALVGADGALSAVGKYLGLSPPSYSGYSAYRCVPSLTGHLAYLCPTFPGGRVLCPMHALLLAETKHASLRSLPWWHRVHMCETLCGPSCFYLSACMNAGARCVPALALLRVLVSVTVCESVR